LAGRCGRSRTMIFVAGCSKSIGLPFGGIAMSKTLVGPKNFRPSAISFALDFHAPMSAPPVLEPVSLAPDRGSGTKLCGSSGRSRRASSSSRTSPMAKGGGCARCGPICTLSVTEPAPSKYLPPKSALPTSGDGFSYLPTPSATPYGSGQNGCPHDGRAEYAGKGKPSLWTLARRAGGPLSPLFVEAMMGFPEGWTEI
jgi:hypothetical protein